jgi:SAM-dependent methyltransferase
VWFRVGWALETSAAAAGRIASDHRVVVGSFETAELPDHYFDVVSMQDCLEHLPEPLEALGRVRRLLRPGGAFLATTPDVDSWLRRIQGRSWVSLKFPEHVVLYARGTLRRALERSGFRVEHLEPAGQFARLDFLASRALSGHPDASARAARWVRRLAGNAPRAYVPSGSLTVVATCPE